MLTYKIDKQLPPLPTTRRGYKANFSADPKGENLLYSHDRRVIIRNVKNPYISREVLHHQFEVSACALAPNGYQVGSGDVRGNLIVWSLDNENNAVKYKGQVLTGRVNEIAWDGMSERIATVGEGRETFGHVMLLSTESKIGNASVHCKQINSVDFVKSGKKYLATGSDDGTCVFYAGPPYKMQKVIDENKGFVHCVRFSPDSKYLAACNMGGSICVYEASDNPKKLTEMSTGPGSLFFLSWVQCSNRIVSCSATGHVNLWDLETQKLLNSIRIEGDDSIASQQVACVCLEDRVASLSLTGDINYIDFNSGKVFQVIKGPSTSITSVANDLSSRIWSGGYHGSVCMWDPSSESPCVRYPESKKLSMNILSLESGQEGLFVLSADNTLSYLDYGKNDYTSTVNLPCTVNSMCLKPGTGSENDRICAVTVEDGLCLCTKNEILKTIKLEYNSTAVAFSHSGRLLAIGENSGKVRVYNYSDISEGIVKPVLVLSRNLSGITSIDFSSDDKMIAVGDCGKKILVYSSETGEVLINKWSYHSSKVNSVKWSPDSKHAASGSLDNSVEIWSVDTPMRHTCISHAHQGSVTSVLWSSNDTLVTSGHDSVLKIWKITY